MADKSILGTVASAVGITTPEVTPATTGATPVSHSSVAADFDQSGPANIAAADEFSPSGAPRQVTEFDNAHPAIDNDPRAGTTVNMNKIDMNDHTRPGHKVVEDLLKDQAAS